MAGRHWTDDELIGRLYEVGPDDSHLKDCEDCARRWRQLVAARVCVTEPPPVSEEFLLRERRAIYDRIQSAGAEGVHWSLTPVLAAAVMVLLAVLLSRPAPNVTPAVASSDAQFFAELYNVVQSTEPPAVEPIRGLFEVEQ